MISRKFRLKKTGSFRMLTAKEKQKNFFKSFYTIAKNAKTVERDDRKYKVIPLVIPVECIEEIKEWSEEEC